MVEIYCCVAKPQHIVVVAVAVVIVVVVVVVLGAEQEFTET